MTQVVPILRVSDVDASLAWWQRVGFRHDFTHRYGGGTTHRFMGIRRDGADIFLSENVADADGPALVFVWVPDVDAVAAEFGVEIEQHPWARDFEVTDPDGNRVRVGTKEVGQSA
ncbi:glyoxalase superfamily protein [Micropruina sonneratiae]|uniref:glyoxalase superfamily protein n=1 Tax=Micropruina sonneratiae TaxID=2986940 RepID=UPI002227000B|nr:glyoxalase superfamily protein [Micropruina sp. KQZ13P-5]MCW3159136.1 glyoxalase superfamily protein [Micropruina sp. KQZ13P-5]